MQSANVFTDKLKAKFGIPTIRPVIGESFDQNNDLYLVDACTVLHRDGTVTRGSAASVTHDALIVYNRKYMDAESFADFYGDDPTECGFGG
jgi:hypothetical protein